ncbi:zeta toxin family protein [Kribbella sp. NPDC051587]|uniref:zeta toxin family protein n=1 Tax=Kribbella sp. NPDC051587 TaxID=3364119 RepID=UPI0037924D9F
MAEVADLGRYRLNEELHAEIFSSRIVPRELAGAMRQERPAVVFIGGQPGAGKTATTDMIKRTMGLRGQAAHVCGDFYKPYHPDYVRLQAEDERTAGAYTRLDTRLWHAAAEDWARARGCHTVVETALADPEEFARAAANFGAAGFRVEVAVLAVPEALSRLGIVARYLDQIALHGRGRFVARSNHDGCYRGIPATIAAVQANQLADNVIVFRRGAAVVTAAQRAENGSWSGSQHLAEDVAGERSRPWGTTASLKFCTSLNRIAQQGGPTWHPELREIAQLAAPLATALDGGFDAGVKGVAAVVGPGEE